MTNSPVAVVPVIKSDIQYKALKTLTWKAGKKLVKCQLTHGKLKVCFSQCKKRNVFISGV